MFEMTLNSALFAYQKARHGAVEAFVDHARQTHGTKLACDECDQSWCCYQLPLVHPIEGLVVAFQLMQEGRHDLIRAAGEQGARQIKALESAGYHQDMTEMPPPDQLDAVLHEWYRRMESCVFLDDGCLCSIYHLRPLCCSTYYTAEKCKQRYLPEDLVPTLDNTGALSWGLTSGSGLLSRLMGLTEAALFPPIPLGVAVASNWPELLRGG